MSEIAQFTKQLKLRADRYQHCIPIDLTQIQVVDILSTLHDQPNDNNNTHENNEFFTDDRDSQTYIKQTVLLSIPNCPATTIETQYSSMGTATNTVVNTRRNSVRFSTTITQSIQVDSIKIYSKQQYSYSTQRTQYKYFYMDKLTNVTGVLNRFSLPVLRTMLDKLNIACTSNNLLLLYVLSGFEYLFQLSDINGYISRLLMRPEIQRYAAKQHIKLVMNGMGWLPYVTDLIEVTPQSTTRTLRRENSSVSMNDSYSNGRTNSSLCGDNSQASQLTTQTISPKSVLAVDMSKRDIINVCNLIVQYIPLDDYLLLYEDRPYVQNKLHK